VRRIKWQSDASWGGKDERPAKEERQRQKEMEKQRRKDQWDQCRVEKQRLKEEENLELTQIESDGSPRPDETNPGRATSKYTYS